MRRRRLTWESKVADSELPNEGYDHPADQGQQPAEKYFIDNDGNGVGSEPADFNEDVHKGPYPNGAAPALPTEASEHPAAMKQAAMSIRASVERKASKCIRIAQATLGRNATISQIEDQALSFMDMSDDDVDATLTRLSNLTVEAKEEEAEEEAQVEEKAEEKKEASYGNVYAEEDAELEAFMAEFMEEADEEEAMFDASSHMSEEEAMLEEMMAEMEAGQMEAHKHEVHHDKAPVVIEEAPAPVVEDVVMMDSDPMGLMMDEEPALDDDLLAGLFADRMAKKSEDEEEAKEEAKEEGKEKEEAAAESMQEEAEAEAKEEKKASRLRPRARKASTGVKSVGAVSKTAKSEIDDLSKLWESAPNLKDLF